MDFSYLRDMKREGRRLVMITAYDAAFAGIIARSGAVDLLLVGDSLAMVVQGKETTREVTLEQMEYHTEMAARGAARSLERSSRQVEDQGLEPAGEGGESSGGARVNELLPIIGDMPYGTFSTPERAVIAARRLIRAGAHGVKIEGSDTAVVRALTDAGIPVMGHLGLLPQTAERFTVQGKQAEAAEKMLADALALEEAGAFSLVLECIPRALAERISSRLTVPTIGIGAGPGCDGQVLVLHDMLGLTEGYLPKFVKPFADLGSTTEEGVRSYARAVRAGTFPDDAHSYH
jgi:3-methyl-2-oxobutanoate hydroxymethyltransferase